MQFISDFADAAVIFPFAFGVWLLLTALGFRIVIGQWAVAVAGVLLSMLAIKAGWLFVAAQSGKRAMSPSGHTASACIVYGGLAWLMLRHAAIPWLAIAVPLLIIAAVGASRIAVGAHDPAEVAMGAAVGLAGLALLRRAMAPGARVPGWPIMAVAVVVIPLAHGHRLPIEKALHGEIVGRAEPPTGVVR